MKRISKDHAESLSAKCSGWAVSGVAEFVQAGPCPPELTLAISDPTGHVGQDLSPVHVDCPGS